MIIKAQGNTMTIASQENFISWLDQELSFRNWSDYQLAKKAGISRTTITRIEDGKHNPTLETVFSLANALDLTMQFT